MLILVLLAAGALLWLLVQKKEEQRRLALSVPQQEIVYTSEEFLMDTLVTQKVYGEDGEQAIALVNQMIKDMELVYSNYLTDSEIGKVNAKAGLSPVRVTPEVFGVVKRSLQLSEDTNGIFDITIAPLVKLWGITSETPKVPTSDEISNALSYVDYKEVLLNESEQSIYLPRPGVSLDLGAIVKGYAAQICGETYSRQNITGALLSLGGTVVSVGTKEDGSPFQVGLRDPKGTANDLFGVLAGEKRVIATSGGYERFFEQDGKRYEHILDPRSGMPVETDLLSVTAVSEDGLLADFLSTSLYMLGSDTIRQNLNRKEFSVIGITREGKVLISDDLKDHFTLKEGISYSFE